MEFKEEIPGTGPTINLNDKSSIQITLDYPLANETEKFNANFKLFIFPPSTLTKDSGWSDPKNFYQSKKHNLRWHTPKVSENIFKFPVTKKYLDLKENINSKESLISDVIGEIKLFTNRAIRLLKYTETEELKQKEAKKFLELLKSFRTDILSLLEADSTVHHKVKQHATWCDEYLSYFFNDFLLRHNLSNELIWKKFLSQEAKYIVKYKDYNVLNEDKERRRFLQRISMLKKFVNHILYLNLSQVKKSSYKKNIAAATAAGLAAAINFFAQYSSQYGGHGRDNNIKFFILMAIAVTIYILKDRVKDLSKEYFNNKIISNSPDFEYKIYSENMPEIPKTQLGLLKENAQFIDATDLSEEVYYIWKKARQRATGSIVRDTKVLVYDRNLEIHGQHFPYQADWKLKDILKINFSDFFHSIKDVSKHLSFYDDEMGKVQFENDKSYSLDLVLKYSFDKHGEKEIQYKTYRLFLERDGIIEIEPTSKEIDYTYKEVC